MYWLPYHSFLLETPYTREQALEKLRFISMPKKGFNFKGGFKQKFFPDKIQVSTFGFRLQRYLDYQETWKEEVSGRYISTRYGNKNFFRISLGFSIGTYVFWGGFLFLSALIALNGPLPLLLFPAFFYFIFLVFFNCSAPSMKEYISKLLAAKS